MRYSALILAVFMISCSGESSRKAKKINESYIHSKSFQSFRRQTQQENKLAKREKIRLASFFKKVMNRMPDRPIKSPVVIDSAVINQAISGNSRNPEMITLFEVKQIYHAVGWLEKGSVTYYFFLTCKINYFDSCLIWLATGINKNIKAIKTIAPYYDALPYKEFPTVHLRPPHILVHVKRKTMYPIKQNHSFEIAFRVNKNGEITRRN